MAVRAAAAVFLGTVLLSSVLRAQGGEPAAAAVAPGETAPARLGITSDSDCPSGPAITAGLAELGPPEGWPIGTVGVRTLGDKLIVDLISGTTTQRELPLSGDCATRATTVALVIATWTGELSSAAVGEPALRPATGAPVPGAAPTPAPAARAPSFTERELGAGLLLSLSDGFAAGAEIDYVQTRAPRGLGWQASVMLPTQRQSTAADLSTRWTRAAASLAVNGRASVHPVALSASMGLAAAYTIIAAHGYTYEQDARAFTLGIGAEVRVAIPWGPLRVWSALRAGRWLLPQSVMIETQGGDRVATIDLPSWDFQAAVGLSTLFR